MFEAEEDLLDVFEEEVLQRVALKIFVGRLLKEPGLDPDEHFAKGCFDAAEIFAEEARKQHADSRKARGVNYK